MTTILDSTTPRIDEPRVVVKPRTYVTPALLILLAAGTLTFLNLAAAVYTYRSTSNLIAIEKRLGDLKAFEDRVAGQLDRMNAGIQARLEMLQSDFRGEIGGLRDETSRLTIPPSASSEAGANSQNDPLQSEAPEIEPEPVTEPVSAETQESVAEDASPPPKRTARANEKPPAYERIQSQDGKVYYRKVQ